MVTCAFVVSSGVPRKIIVSLYSYYSSFHKFLDDFWHIINDHDIFFYLILLYSYYISLYEFLKKNLAHNLWYYIYV